MIPKVIHYVWLSGEEMPELNRKCVESWQRVLAGYELRQWTLTDVDAFSVPFVSEAVREKKWAFATDSLRAEILLREGGIYLDTDVFLYHGFDDLLQDSFFSFIEFHHDSTAAAIQAACMGAEAGHPYIQACADYYRDRHFLRADGSMDTEKLAPDLFAEIAVGFGFDTGRPTAQELSCGMKIYDRAVLAGTAWELDAESRGVHLCAGSWRGMSSAETEHYTRLKLLMVARPGKGC